MMWDYFYGRHRGLLVIAATRDHIYVFSRGWLSSGRLRGLIRRYDVAGASVAPAGPWGGVDIGSDRYWIASPVSRGDLDDFLTFVRARQDLKRSTPR